MPSDDEASGPADLLASALRTLHARAGAPSTRNLAQRIGTVSHTTVAEALAGKRLSSWSTISEIVRALGGDLDEFERLWLSASAAAQRAAEQPEDNFVSRYLRQVAAFANYLEPADPSRRVLVPFAQLYVRQKVKDLGTGEEADIWAFDGELRRAVLLGDPGSGKSTFCRALMLRHATETGRPVPFLVTLRHFAATVPPAWSVVRYIERTVDAVFQIPVPDGAVVRLLARGQALVVFDGLDELTGAASRDVASVIELFTQQFPQARVLVTSRFAGYSHARLDPNLFQTYKLLQFTEDEAASYIRQWFAAMPTPDRTEEERERDSDRFLYLTSRIPELQSSPLLLGFAAQLFAHTSRLPSSLTALVGSSVDLLLNEWDRSRGIETLLSLPLESALQDLAFRMLDMASPSLPENGVLELLTEFLQGMVSTDAEATAAARSILSYARDRAWILVEVGLDRAGKGLYQFSHRAFQEYLAARSLTARADPVHDLAERLPDPNWRMAAEFALELLNRSDPGGAEALIAALAAKAAKLPSDSRRSAAEFLVAYGYLPAAVKARPDRLAALRLAGHPVDLLSEEHQKLFASLSEEEVALLTSIRRRFDAIEDDDSGAFEHNDKNEGPTGKIR